MARTAITKNTLVGSYPALPLTAGSATMSETAADTTDLNSATFGSFSRLLVIARNTNAGAQTVTITSVADGLNRTGDITTYSIAAGGIFANVFERNGWMQSADQSLYFQASHADVKFVIIGL